MNFEGEWMNLENTFLSEVTQIHACYLLTCKWILVLKYRIPTTLYNPKEAKGQGRWLNLSQKGNKIRIRGLWEEGTG